MFAMPAWVRLNATAYYEIVGVKGDYQQVETHNALLNKTFAAKSFPAHPIRLVA